VIDGRGDGVHGLDEPVAAAVDRDGNVWVAGKRSQNLFRVGPDGVVGQIAAADDLRAIVEPTALVIDSDGVPHLGGANGVVVAVAPWGEIVSERGPGSPVSFMAIDSEDRIIVSGGDRVERRSVSGTWQLLLDGDGDGSVPYGGSGPISVGPNDDLYTVGRDSHYWFYIRSDGLVTGNTTCEEIGRASDIVAHAELVVTLSGSAGLCHFDGFGTTRLFPESSLGPIEIDADGGVAAVDTWGSRTLYLDAAGNWSTLLSARGVGSGHRLWWPTDLAVGGDGSVYVSAWLSGNVFRVAPSGRIHVPFAGGTNESDRAIAPGGVAVAPDHTLYLLDFDGGNQLWRVNVPACQDLRDNDGDGRIDEDDPECRRSARESPPSCGLGPELVLLAGLARRRLTRRGPRPAEAG
jgi:hypothetical protein